MLCENVSFGATSPVFLAILSFIYSYFGIEHLLSIAKLVNLTFYFTALIFCKKIIFFILEKENSYFQNDQFSQKNSILLIAVVFLSMGLFPHLIDASLRLYETSLVLSYTQY